MENRRGLSVRLSIAIYLFSLFVFVAIAIVPDNFSETEDSVVTVNSQLLRGIFQVGICFSSLLLLSAIIAIFRPTIKYPVVAALFAIIGLTGSFCIHFCLNIAPWIEHSRIEINGEIYCFSESSFLQGQTLALTKIDREGLFTTHYSIIGITNGDNPRYWISLIRPEGLADNRYGQLIHTPDHLLLGVRYENRCFFAYDLVNRKFIKGDDILVVSPFLEIGKESGLHQPDVDRNRLFMQSNPADTRGYPHRDAVQLDANSHPNPKVRGLASEMLTWMKQPDRTK